MKHKWLTLRLFAAHLNGCFSFTVRWKAFAFVLLVTPLILMYKVKVLHVQRIFVGQGLGGLVSCLSSGTGWSCHRKKEHQRQQSCRNPQCSGMTQMMRWVCYLQCNIICLLPFAKRYIWYRCLHCWGNQTIFCKEKIFVQISAGILSEISSCLPNLFCFVSQTSVGESLQREAAKKKMMKQVRGKKKNFTWLEST